MPMPPSVTKVDKNGVSFTSSVDQAEYLMMELVRAANRDVGKYVARIARRNLSRRTGAGRSAIQYWNRRDGSLQIGYKGGRGFYAAMYELGTSKTPRLMLISDAVESNISTIREIQGQYLSAIEDANRAQGMIDEAEEVSDDTSI